MRRWRLLVPIVPAGLLFLPATGWVAPYWIYNTGLSMPVGLYLSAPWERPGVGSVVVMKDPPRFKLPWLMKRTVAVGGMRYCWHEELGTHMVDAQVMPPPLPAAVARGLEPWRGCRLLEPDEIVGYGQSADSFDSRYAFIGPVRTSQLYGTYTPLWVYEQH